MNKEKSLLAIRINQMRKDLNLTQEDLALKLGLKGKSSIANYESGNITPSDEIKLKMCKVFNCTMDYLTGNSDFKTAFDEFLNTKHSLLSLKDFGNKDYLDQEQHAVLTAWLYRQLQEGNLSEELSEESKLRISQMYNGLLSIPKLKKVINDFNSHPENYAYKDEIYHDDSSNDDDLIDIFDAFEFELTPYERDFIMDCIPNECMDEKLQYFNGDDDRKKYITNCYTTILDFINFMQEKSDEPLAPIKKLSDINSILNYKKILKQSNISKENLDKFYMCPVYGQIAAGQPNWAEECLDGYLPLDPQMMNISNPEECFFLRVNGESMNRIIKNDAYALIRKTDFVENGEIAVVLVDKYDATLKKFTQQGDLIILEPMSNDPSFTTQVYGKDTEIKILGKYIGKMEMK